VEPKSIGLGVLLHLLDEEEELSAEEFVLILRGLFFHQVLYDLTFVVPNCVEIWGKRGNF